MGIIENCALVNGGLMALTRRYDNYLGKAPPVDEAPHLQGNMHISFQMANYSI